MVSAILRVYLFKSQSTKQFLCCGLTHFKIIARLDCLWSHCFNARRSQIWPFIRAPRIGQTMRIRRLTQSSLVAAALIATALVCAPGSSAINVVTGLTTQAPVYPAANDPTSVTTIDSTTGQVIAQWNGPESQKAAALAAQRSAIGSGPSTGSPGLPGGFTTNISRHSPCTAGTGYFEIWNYPPLVCYANSGAVSVSIGSVYEVDTGNNVGGVHFTCGAGTCNTGYSPKWSTILFNTPSPTVNYVYIQ
jgi:hypothetical protein